MCHRTSFGISNHPWTVLVEVWTLKVVLDKSHQNCGQIQSIKQVLLLSEHQQCISCLTMSHCEPLIVRQLGCPSPWVVSQGLYSAPPCLVLPKRVECVVPVLPQTVLCITSASVGVCASTTQVSRWSIAWNCFHASFYRILYSPCSFRWQNNKFCHDNLYFAEIQLTKCICAVTHQRCAMMCQRTMRHAPLPEEVLRLLWQATSFAIYALVCSARQQLLTFVVEISWEF